ncbi:threonine/serine ThrE exporter family protein [Nocardioides nanhaiensis]|uniref:Threonine/serine exporter family protein n=1 Tax=Nocardioides nanhaiensis TaxID=1476871 RepID=A0ABP8W604_9ACTN
MRPLVDPQEVAPTLDLCLRVGEILMSNGAGAADVTATMRSLAFHRGLRGAELDVTFTSLSMSWQDPGTDDPPVVMLRQVKQRDIDYEDLTRVDHLVRDVLADRTTLREARAEAARIASSGHQTARAAITVAWGVMCAGIAIMLGGDPLVVAVASVTAMVIDRLQLAMGRRRLPAFYQQVAGGGVATLMAIGAVTLGLADGLSLMVTANIVMLLSGIGLMGALQDALSGFYVTSSARLLEAMLATAGIIGGVSGGLAVAEIAGIEVGRFVPGRTAALDTLTLMAVGAGVAAAAFAVASYAPWRVVPAIGLIAAGATLLSQAPLLAGFPRAWSVGVAALGIGLVSYGVAGRFRVPPLVVVVSAIVPLLPGLTIYRGLSLLTESSGDFRGVLALVVAASTALALAAGVILGEYLAQPLKREARRLEGRLSGPRLVGPLRERTRTRSRRPGADPDAP